MSEIDLVQGLRAIGFKGSDDEANGLLRHIGLLNFTKNQPAISSADLGAYVGGRWAMAREDLLYPQTYQPPTEAMIDALVGLALLCGQPLEAVLPRLNFAANYPKQLP